MIPPRTLYLMRHGESEANAAHIFAGWSIDPALTPEGRRQAGQQASLMREAGLGELDGRSYDIPALRAVFDGVLARWQRREYDAGFPGGETLRDLGERFTGFLAGLPADHGPLLEDPGPSLLAWRLGHCEVTVMARNGTPGFHPRRLRAAPGVP